MTKQKQTAQMCLLALILSISFQFAKSQSVAEAYTESEWLSFNSWTLDDLDDYTVDSDNLEFSKYGGWKAHQIDATGFFRVEKIDGRWWAVDPDGYLYINKAVNSVKLENYTANEAFSLLTQYGFNGLGNWSDEDIIESSMQDDTPLAYCPKFSFIGGYRTDRDPRIEMPVFDDEFVTFCNENADYFEKYVDDPNVFGFYSDNELSWTVNGLSAHLEIEDEDDKNYQAAIQFLEDQGKTISDYDDTDIDEYTELMAEAYFAAVGSAIKAVDANHLYLGTRLNKSWKRTQGFIEIASEYIDVFAINHYHRWGTREVEIKNIEKWSGKPLLVSEFYAMETDEPEEVTGAGWRVTNQESRGIFYHNYIIDMAKSGCVVGWQWFKFQDDDEGTKGIVDTDGEPYTVLLTDMLQFNDEIYNYVDYLDTKSSADLTLRPEADAYFKGSTNYGDATELMIKSAGSKVHRESYLRFDLSAISSDVESAIVRLYATAEDKEAGSYQAELVNNNSWDEMSITNDNKPEASTVLASWSHGDDIEIDVTDVLNDALDDDNLLTIRIISTLSNGSIPVYGSKENSNENTWPKLSVFYSSSLASPWETTDVGSVAAAGSASYEDETFYLEGSGSDIWGTADEFRFVYQQVSGDVVITARVNSIENTDAWAKSGVMVRQNLDESSQHAMAIVSSSNGSSFQRRTTASGSSTHTTVSSVSAPAWVRLVRSDNTFTSYYSSDGNSWTIIGSETITMSDIVYVGLITTSHDDGTLCSATFDNVLVSTAELTSNLALNKSLSVSDESSSNPGSNVVDGDADTRWSASGFSQWLEVDLGATYSISSSELVFYDDRAYEYTIEVSTDGSSYTEIVDRSDNTTSGSNDSPVSDSFDEVDARYVRLTITGIYNSTVGWVAVDEFRVFGDLTSMKYSNVDESAITDSEVSDLLIYPNPTSENLFLNTELLSDSDKIEIYSSVGQMMYSLSVKEINESIDVSQLQSGTYILKIKGSTSQTKLFVKH